LERCALASKNANPSRSAAVVHPIFAGKIERILEEFFDGHRNGMPHRVVNDS
jgi:hypothetical protein